ncbi:ABC transporter ATP-binding protein [Skermania sp. ID1734]|uniref:ABC transporter ATP-binding protein n=1 Tax=Skermania sp. ID1734 TaxID=2597516 RepID=UPI00117DDFE9|nr:ABC transporter ATP-binding protein [Skermania sp. ID1734]TSD93545.1 ABC transporter ATP-binding protein [Skermania sp. ID1734]
MSTSRISSIPAVSVRGLTKRFGRFTAVDNVDFDIDPDRIYGLLGRNGAGKTTVMQMLTGQLRQTSGDISIFGQQPFENPVALARVCFVKESQRYPEDYRVKHVLAAASQLLPNWNNDFAHELIKDFDIPLDRKMKKLSRGTTSAVGVTVGLASRAPLTIFDEPYLGLDAVSRTMFYDRLLADFSENPRTIVLSTHLIDEVSDLIEHVLVIDKGRILLDDNADALRSRAVMVSGPARTVEAFAADHAVLHRESLSSLARATVAVELTDAERNRALAAGLQLEPVSLQQLVVRSTTAAKESA